MQTRNQSLFEMTMGEPSEELVRRGTIILAVVGFFVHIALWALHTTSRISIEGDAVELVSSPLTSLYTPFSILLVYEVYPVSYTHLTLPTIYSV